MQNMVIIEKRWKKNPKRPYYLRKNQGSYRSLSFCQNDLPIGKITALSLIYFLNYAYLCFFNVFFLVYRQSFKPLIPTPGKFIKKINAWLPKEWNLSLLRLSYLQLRPFFWTGFLSFKNRLNLQLNVCEKEELPCFLHLKQIFDGRNQDITSLAGYKRSVKNSITNLY